QAAGDNGEVGAAPGAGHGLGQPVEVIAHLRHPVTIDAERGEFARQKSRVGVGNGAEQQFGADGEDFRVHWGSAGVAASSIWAMSSRVRPAWAAAAANESVSIARR